MRSRIEKLPNGHYWLGVHIADVSHYVQEGSALDRRGLRARHVGVLPRARRAHVSRRSWRRGSAASIRTSIGSCSRASWKSIARGKVVRYEFHDGVINSDARMTYTAVNAILTDRDPRR